MAASAELQPGVQLGDYTIQARLGSGATSVVYRVVDSAGTVFAAKVHKPHHFESGSRRREHAIKREIRLRERITHPNVCKVYAYLKIHVDGQKLRILISEFIDGETLESLINGRSLDLPVFLAVAQQMVAGLRAIHEGGMLHRDIKPGNVLIERDTARVVIADFGTVRDLVAATVETAGAAFKGTLCYASPEAIERRMPEADDHTTDFYSLGATFFEMATGARPFADVSPQTKLFDAIRWSHPPVIAPGYPVHIVLLIRTLLAKDPSVRPPLSEVTRILSQEHTAVDESPETSESSLDSLRTKLLFDSTLAANRRRQEQGARVGKFYDELREQLTSVLPSWISRLKLDTLSVPVIAVVDMGVPMTTGSQANLLTHFPGREFTSTLYVHVAGQGIRQCSIAYVFAGLPDRPETVRAFSTTNTYALDLDHAVEFPTMPLDELREAIVADVFDVGRAFLAEFLKANLA